MSLHDNQLHQQLMPKMAAYPIRSQAEEEDPLIVAKLFDVAGSATWWLTEYDPDERIAFAYVTGMWCDEWGSVSIDELYSLWMNFAWDPARRLMRVRTTEPGIGIPRIELDENFEPIRFSEVQARLAKYAAYADKTS